MLTAASSKTITVMIMTEDLLARGELIACVLLNCIIVFHFFIYPASRTVIFQVKVAADKNKQPRRSPRKSPGKKSPTRKRSASPSTPKKTPRKSKSPGKSPSKKAFLYTKSTA